MTDPNPLPDPLQSITGRLARAARDGGARAFGQRVYALAMRYGELRAQAAAHAARAGERPHASVVYAHADEPAAVAWSRAAEIADRLAAELDPDRAAGPGLIDPDRLDYLDRELGRFAGLMHADPFTDPAAHAVLTTLRMVMRRYDQAMTAQGVPPDARDRVGREVLFGHQDGPEAPGSDVHRMAHLREVAEMPPPVDEPRKP